MHRIGSVSPMAGQISMGARREVVLAVAERYRLAERAEKGRILDELCRVTGWHRKHAVRALGDRSTIVLIGHANGSRPTARSSRMQWLRCGRRLIGSAASGSR